MLVILLVTWLVEADQWLSAGPCSLPMAGAGADLCSPRVLLCVGVSVVGGTYWLLLRVVWCTILGLVKADQADQLGWLVGGGGADPCSFCIEGILQMFHASWFGVWVSYHWAV